MSTWMIVTWTVVGTAVFLAAAFWVYLVIDDWLNTGASRVAKMPEVKERKAQTDWRIVVLPKMAYVPRDPNVGFGPMVREAPTQMVTVLVRRAVDWDATGTRWEKIPIGDCDPADQEAMAELRVKAEQTIDNMKMVIAP